MFVSFHLCTVQCIAVSFVRSFIYSLNRAIFSDFPCIQLRYTLTCGGRGSPSHFISVLLWMFEQFMNEIFIICCFFFFFGFSYILLCFLIRSYGRVRFNSLQFFMNEWIIIEWLQQQLYTHWINACKWFIYINVDRVFYLALAVSISMSLPPCA